MRYRALLVSLLVLSGLAALPGALWASNFNFSCLDNNYVSRPLGVTMQFHQPISAVPPGNDSVDVIFEPHLPDGWFSQWCQLSTGICFDQSVRIRLSVGIQDRLDIDFFPSSDLPAMGWIDMTIRSVADPLEVARCTYTLYSGMPVPPASFTFDSSDNIRRLSTGDYAEFFSPIQNTGVATDTLIVRMFSNTTNGMWAQFCQVSTGICFGDLGWLPMTAGLTDQLHIQVFIPNSQASGAFDFAVQSKRNPSLVKYGYYRVFQGSWPADVAATTPATPHAWVSPNPSSGQTSIVLQSVVAGSGALTVYGADGRVVRSFPRVDLAAGSTAVRWDGRDNRGTMAAPGIYFYRLVAGEASARGTIVRTN